MDFKETLKDAIKLGNDYKRINRKLKQFVYIQRSRRNDVFDTADNDKATQLSDFGGAEKAVFYKGRQKTPEVTHFLIEMEKNDSMLHFKDYLEYRDNKEIIESYFPDPVQTLKDLKIRHRKDITKEDAYNTLIIDIYDRTENNLHILQLETYSLVQPAILPLFEKVIDQYNGDKDKCYTERKIGINELENMLFDLDRNANTFKAYKNDADQYLLVSHNAAFELHTDGEIYSLRSKGKELKDLMKDRGYEFIQDPLSIEQTRAFSYIHRLIVRNQPTLNAEGERISSDDYSVRTIANAMAMEKGDSLELIDHSVLEDNMMKCVLSDILKGVDLEKSIIQSFNSYSAYNNMLLKTLNEGFEDYHAILLNKEQVDLLYAEIVEDLTDEPIIAVEVDDGSYVLYQNDNILSSGYEKIVLDFSEIVMLKEYDELEIEKTIENKLGKTSVLESDSPSPNKPKSRSKYRM